MALFISYSSKDIEPVRLLAQDLEAGQLEVWLDQELHGGDAWWQEILRRIRLSTIFILALSKNAQTSQPCQAEVKYARDLEIPVLPVQIGPVENLRVENIGQWQILDYRERTAARGIQLATAVQSLSLHRKELPSPLPEPPPVPFAYLLRFTALIRQSEHLMPRDQETLVRDLGKSLAEEDEESVLDDIRSLLVQLRRRSDLTVLCAREIEKLLGESSTAADRSTVGDHKQSGMAAASSDSQSNETAKTADPAPQQTTTQVLPPAGWYPDPSTPGVFRYWDGLGWTHHFSRNPPR